MKNFIVKSKTNVITNSSTEVFNCFFKDDVDAVKEIVNLVLQASGSTNTCDDLFMVTLEYDNCDDLESIKEMYNDVINGTPDDRWYYLRTYLKDPGSYPSVPTREDIDHFVEECMEGYIIKDEDNQMSVDGPMTSGIKLIAKDPGNQGMADRIGKLITNIGECYEVGFC